MKKRVFSLLLTLAMVLALLPATASAAELPDWYFLFAIFKNVDADGKDKDGKTVHVKYSMSQEEVDYVKESAQYFEEDMTGLGVMRAHVDVVEIDTTVTELGESAYGARLAVEQAGPLLEKNKVDLDKYDHVFCQAWLNDLATDFVGLTGATFANKTGLSFINFSIQSSIASKGNPWRPSLYVHEYLHFVERLNKRWGVEFNEHNIQSIYNTRYVDDWKGCYTDIILNRVKGNSETGTGVAPVVWQYPPHVLRTMTELVIPSGVTSIGHDAFLSFTNLTRVTIPSSVTCLDVSAFHGCTNLTSIFIPTSVTSIKDWAFNKSGLTDVYYGGTEAQWKAVKIEGHNAPLSKATIHYQSSAPAQTQTTAPSFQDVPSNAYYAQPVSWAVEKGVTGGTSKTTFSPGNTCTKGQILTFLWRANGSPAPAGTVGGTEYYASAVQWAKEQNIIGEGLVPGEPCTRGNAVTYLWNLAGKPIAPSVYFEDVSALRGPFQAVNWAVQEGITSGVSEHRFEPNSPCTRGQIVTFLYRALA